MNTTTSRKLKTRATKIFALLFLPNESPVRGDVPISEVSEFQITLKSNTYYKELLEKQGKVPIGFDQNGYSWLSCVQKDEKRFMYHYQSGRRYLLATANLPSLSPDYIELLIGRGWKIKPEFLEQYAPHLLNTELVAQ